MSLTHFSLFTGIGGIDLAAEWAGFTTAGQCELADYPTKVLEKHWPNVPRWRDIRTVKDLPSMFLLSAGIPCQQHSLANQQRTGDLFEWNETFRIIGESNPCWVLIENVAGIQSTALDTILNDLAGEDYEVTAYVIPAIAVGATHKRESIYYWPLLPQANVTNLSVL